jgi:hypothetical protein
MTEPSYRGLRLDGPLAEFHRAVDRLRWDTCLPRSTTNPKPTTAAPSPP